MRRKRRSRFNWFPVNPTFIGEGTTPFTWYRTELNLSPVVGTGSDPLAVPLLQDQDQQTGQSDAGISLRDRVEGKDYAVERVVGKVWGAVSQDQADSSGEYVASQIIVGMGFAVLPVNDNSGQPDLDTAEYDPLNADNSGAPWMWRRTWVLYNNLASPEPFFTGPTNIGSYGSVADGGHVDIKSVRRVRREQRLFWCVSSSVLRTFNNDGTSVPISVALDVGYDIRVLGGMRRAQNNSTFK